MIELPWPPSVNTYWRNVRGRTLISKKGREYRQMIVRMALVHHFPQYGSARLSVEMEACPPDNRRRDLDNVFKATLDALQSAGVYDDDGQIDVLNIKRGDVVEDGCLKIIIEQLPCTDT